MKKDLDYLNDKMKCEKCGKEIKKNEKKVLFKEYDDKKVYTKLYFHTNCWIEHYNESLNKKIRNYSERIMNQVAPLLQEKLMG